MGVFGVRRCHPRSFDTPNFLTPPVYFRALVNFTRSIDYSSRLEDPDSEEFREISEAVVDTVRPRGSPGGAGDAGGHPLDHPDPSFSAPQQLESEYYKVPGEQVVSVVFIK